MRMSNAYYCDVYQVADSLSKDYDLLNGPHDLVT